MSVKTISMVTLLMLAIILLTTSIFIVLQDAKDMQEYEGFHNHNPICYHGDYEDCIK